MNEKNVEEKMKIMRYAQLIFKQEGLLHRSMKLPDEEVSEIESIRQSLGMTHEQILDRAAKNLIEELE